MNSLNHFYKEYEMKKKSIYSLVVASFVISSTLVAEDVKADNKDQSTQPSTKKEQAASQSVTKSDPIAQTSPKKEVAVQPEAKKEQPAPSAVKSSPAPQASAKKEIAAQPDTKKEQLASEVIKNAPKAHPVAKKEIPAQPDTKKKQSTTRAEKKTTQTQLTSSNFKIEVTQEHAVIIDEIITTMGNSSVIGLGFKRGHLHALGKKIDGIGSLQFLGYIFSQEKLKKHMINIRKSSMKWNGFMDGIKPGLNKIEETKELYVDLPGFASTLKVATDPLVKKAEERDWNGFVSYLVKN